MNTDLRACCASAEIYLAGSASTLAFRTDRLATTKNGAAVAEEMRNSPAVVRTHYQNVTSPEHAAAWWKVPPAALETIPFLKGPGDLLIR